MWSISGSDSSGGAGIQADIKTAQRLGCELCTLITANTVQNSQSFIEMNSVEVAVLESQYQALKLDKPPVVVKIGLLASLQQVEWLLKIIVKLRNRYPQVKFVLDPVLKASVMQDNFQESISASYLNLLEAVDVITPNFDEAMLLVQTLNAKQENKVDNPVNLAKFLQKSLTTAVIVKGGHFQSKVSKNYSTDVCVEDSQVYKVTTKRIKTTFSHGGGCSFATAISYFLAQSLPLKDVLVQTKAFMQKGFSLSKGQVENYGAFLQPAWPVEKCFYPQVGGRDLLFKGFKGFEGFPSLETQHLGIYPVVDSIEWLEKLLPFNLKIIQLRLKNVSSLKLPGLVKKAVQLFKNSQTRLFINDYWQVAIENGAYGVHLGQEDFTALNPDERQRLQSSGVRLGLSSHGWYEYLLAEQEKPSYIAFGAIFPSSSKNMLKQIQGLDRLQEICTLRAKNIKCPLVAIGGINKTNLPELVATGVEGVAVISAITQSDKLENDLLEMITCF